MKLAILGSSPQALETAVRFHLHGAAITWFNAAEEEYETLFEKLITANDFITEEGLALLKEQGRSYEVKDFSWQNWKENYFLPLSQLIASEHKLRPHEVVSMAKRYLAPQEALPGKSRFHDLFRVMFQVNPQEFIQEQAASNPETFERLSEELKNSLQKNLEMYEDFDLIIDLRRSTQSDSLSITGRALGETRVSRDQLLYGWEAFKAAGRINQDAQDVRELALVGSGELAAATMLELKDWLKDPRSRLFVVSHEAWPFESFLKEAHPVIKQDLNELFSFMEKEFESEINDFHKKLREWQELDDFVQAKIQRPVEPIPRLVYFSGHNATAVDQLVDKRRLFLTLEKPEFRDGHKHPDNNALDLKTIGVDRVLVAGHMHRPVLEIFLDEKEIGYFSLDLHLPLQKASWESDLTGIKGIENAIFKLFSPAGAH